MLAVVVAVTVFGLDTPLAAFVFALFWTIGAWEWAGLAGIRPKPLRFAYAVLVLAFAVIAILAGLPAPVQDVLTWLAAAVWVAAFYFELRYPTPLANPAIAVAGLVVLAAAWLSFLRLHGAGPEGPALVLSGLAIVWAADIGAFFVGRSIGRRALAPRVSPKKTWEGVGGGVAAAAIAGGVAALALELPLAVLVPIAASIALISVVGDLGLSMLKRRSGLKDTGTLLPGHGGIMDRFDGVTAALPFFVIGLQFAHVLD